MQNQLDAGREIRQERLANMWARVCALLVVILAGLAFSGWFAGLPVLASLGHELVPMAPSTALLLVLCAGILLLESFKPLRPIALWTGVVVTMFVALVASLLLGLSVRGIHLSVEHLGFDFDDTPGGVPMGHMAPLTAACFLMVALASVLSLIFRSPESKWRDIPQWVAIVLTVISIALLLGYLYGTPLMYESGYVPPALTTSLAFLILGLAWFGNAWLLLSDSTHSEKRIRQYAYVLLLSFLVLATAVVTTGWVYFRYMEGEYQEEVELRLVSISDLKVDNLVRWRKERFGDGAVFQDNINFVGLTRLLTEHPDDMTIRKRMEVWLEHLHKAYDYTHVCLHDSQGRKILSVPDDNQSHGENWRQILNDVIKSRQVTLTDFNRSEHDNRIYLGVLVPLFDEERSDSCLGVLSLHIDPHTYLYPAINRWPTPSRTAETLLVRRDGDHVLFLNPLRFKPDAALGLRLSLEKSDLPATRAALGTKGMVHGLDYRGVPVLAYVRAIPDSPWYLVARMDLAEIYAPLRQQFWMLIAFICSLLVATGAIMYSIWRRQHVRHFRERYQAAEALRLQEERYRHTLDGMMEGCQIIGRDWKYQYVNDAAVKQGKKTREELLGNTMMSVYKGIEESSLFAVLERCMTERVPEHLENEFFYSDGTTGNFELSIDPVPEGLFILSADITERKRAEVRLQHLTDVLRALRSVNHLITHEKDRTTLLHRACQILTEMRGYRSAWIATGDSPQTLQAVAESGIGETFKPVWQGLENGDYPECCLLALEREGIVVMHNTSVNCHACPLAYAYHDTAAMSGALRHGDNIYGVLVVALPEGVADDPEEQDLFRELCGDISFALYSIRLEQEQAQSVEALRESERFAHATIDALSAHICVVDQDGVIVAVNQAWRLFAEENGVKADKVSEGVNYFDVCASAIGADAEAATEFAAGIRAVLNGQTPTFLMEYPCHSQQEERWFIGRVTPFQGQGISRVVVAHENITARKQAVEMMLRNQNMLARTETIAHIGSWEWDAATDAVTWSEELFRIFQMDTKEGAPPFSEQSILFHPEDMPLLQDAVQKSLTQGTPYELEMRAIRKDGAIRFCLIRGYVDEDAGASAKRLYGSLQDITESKQAEEEKKNLQMQLNQAQKMEAVGQLAGGVAHDFNNILQAMMGYTQMLIDAAEERGEVSEELTEIYKGAERAATLTRQLLSFSRRQVMQPKTIDLNDLVVNLLKMLHRVIGEHIKVNWLPGSHLGSVHADTGMLEQILMNLCVNARDAMPQEGMLNIETQNVLIDEDYCKAHAWSTPGRYVLLSVTDTGTGIDDETLKHIFEPFFTTKKEGKGTGLGLATVYGIVKQHDGMITAYSEVGKGTTFKIYLPMCEQKATRVGKLIQGAVVGGDEVILMAEDDEAVRDSGTRILERAGYTVHTAKNGQEAIEIFKQHAAQIDLVLLDVVMPVMGGHEAYKHIQSIRDDVPVLFSSGYSENAVHTNFVLHDGLKLIQKPYSLVALMRAVRAALDDSKKDVSSGQ